MATKSIQDFILTTPPSTTDFTKDWDDFIHLNMVTRAWIRECIAERFYACGIVPSIRALDRQIKAQYDNEIQDDFEALAPTGAPSSSNKYYWIAASGTVIRQNAMMYVFDQSWGLDDLAYSLNGNMSGFVSKTAFSGADYLYISRAYDQYIGRVSRDDPVTSHHLLYALYNPLTVLVSYWRKFDFPYIYNVVNNWSSSSTAISGHNLKLDGFGGMVYALYAYYFHRLTTVESISYFGKCEQIINSRNNPPLDVGSQYGSVYKLNLVFAVTERLFNWDNGSRRVNRTVYVVFPYNTRSESVEPTVIRTMARNAITISGINTSDVNYDNPKYKSWQNANTMYSDNITVSLVMIYPEYCLRNRTLVD